MKTMTLILTLATLFSTTFASDLPHASSGKAKKSYKVHLCEKDAKEYADKLLRLHFDQDSNSTNIESLSVEDTVLVRPSILAPSKRGRYDVLEVMGYIYKAEYRMRFIFAKTGKSCSLMGQEILEMSDPF
jgi:hypothetical protein